MITVTILDQLNDLVAAIRARDIPATLDPRSVAVPGALVDLDQIGDDNTMCGDSVATATVWLVVPDNGRAAALGDLFALYAVLEDLTTGAKPATLALPDRTLPALQLNPIPIGD